MLTLVHVICAELATTFSLELVDDISSHGSSPAPRPLSVSAASIASGSWGGVSGCGKLNGGNSSPHGEEGKSVSVFGFKAVSNGGSN